MGYVRIVSAQGLREEDRHGWTDTMVLAEIFEKPESRIYSPTITNTTTPAWYYQELLRSFALGDHLQVSIWGDDPGSSQPEDGDFLGKITIPSVEFYPQGMPVTEFPLLTKEGKEGLGSIKIEIV